MPLSVFREPAFDLAAPASTTQFRLISHLTSLTVHTLGLCAVWYVAGTTTTPAASNLVAQTTDERPQFVQLSDWPGPRLEGKKHVVLRPLPHREAPAPPREEARPPRQDGAEIGVVRTGVFPAGLPVPPPPPSDLGVVRTGVLGSGDPGPVSRGNTIGSVVIGTLDGPVASPVPPAPQGRIRPSFPPPSGPVLEPVALTADIEPAHLLSPVTPEFPDDARRAGVSGTVRLEVRLMRSGEVRVLRVIDGLGRSLNEAASHAVSRTRCSPARQNGGEPIDVTATVRVVFKLS